MRIVGHRKERPITFYATAPQMENGIRFNDSTHHAFAAKNNGVKRGVYHFKSHQAANVHQETCIAENLMRIARTMENIDG